MQKALFERNRDYNVVCLKGIRHGYKLLILPEYVLMSEREAEVVRRFVEDGGTVIMTAYSATVDEHSQVFETSRPGRLADVFGIRIAGFDRTGSEWRDFSEHSKLIEDVKGKRELLKVSAGEEFYIDVEYYEELELQTASAYAVFPEKSLCAISEHAYGKGKAYYVAAETNAEFLKWLIQRLTPSIGLKPGLSVPPGIQAREIADGQRFYVNTTGEAVLIPLERPGKGAISERNYEESLILNSYDAELICEK